MSDHYGKRCAADGMLGSAGTNQSTFREINADEYNIPENKL